MDLLVANAPYAPTEAVAYRRRRRDYEPKLALTVALTGWISCAGYAGAPEWLARAVTRWSRPARQAPEAVEICWSRVTHGPSAPGMGATVVYGTRH
jgi:methylase of polypeptide subunit release factors